MANYVDSNFNFLGFPMGFQRDLGFALDRSEIFDSYEDAVKYATGTLVDAEKDKRKLAPTSYVGQKISVVTDSAVEVYVIDTDRSLRRLDVQAVTVDGVVIVQGDSGLTLKGTKPTFEDLPKTGNVEGDVWHIEADHTEYVWATVDGALNPSWEALGGTIDLTGYALKTDLKSLTFKSGDATAVYSPLTEKEFTFTAGNNITLALASTGLTISATDTKLTNVANSTGKVFTGVSNGTTITTTNVGALVLTGFAASTSDTGALAATDTITKALNKLYNLANSKTSNTGTVTSVATGGGLTGGPITTSGTISHANKPSSGTALEAGTGSGLTFLTEIALDAYGHVATAKKATVTLPTAASLGALTSITAGAGITVNTKSGTTQTVSISTTDTFILDGGTAA